MTERLPARTQAQMNNAVPTASRKGEPHVSRNLIESMPRSTIHTFIAQNTMKERNVWIVLRGMDSIKFLETWGSPFLLAVGVALFVWAAVRAGGVGPMLENPVGRADGRTGGLTGVFGAGLTSAVAFWGTMALSIPDFSRYAKSQRDQVIGQAVGLPGTMALFAFIGAAVTSATAVIFGTRIADPVALLARIGGPLMIMLSMAGLTIATLTTNIAANIVAPANA